MTEKTPRTLENGASVLKYAVVTPDVEPTGFTRHTVDGDLLGPASALAVASYTNDPADECYLYYLDDEGTVVTDTLHNSLEAAVEHAAREYIGLTWADVPH